MSKVQLFEVICKPLYNRNLSERREYLKCSDQKVLEGAIKSCFTSPTSEYFGFVTIDVRPVKNIPELKQIKFDCDICKRIKKQNTKKGERQND